MAFGIHIVSELLERGPRAEAAGARLAAPRGTEVRQWSCPTCEYDLSGLAADAICPECGLRLEPGVLHLSGWKASHDVPTGPRARVRAAIVSLWIAAFVAVPLSRRMGLLSWGVPWPVWVLGLAALIFTALLLRSGRSAAASTRPVHVQLAPDGVRVPKHWTGPKRVAWSRFERLRFRRVRRGMYRLELLAPFWRRHFHETWPWNAGLWHVRAVFPASRRDAALVRRIARRRLSAAPEPLPPRP
ncbi:MAG: hypothetical protein KDA05_11185 [Phycisphaerales bacterium]|nr:hypothetical protein [Phycisphaerales bacterium]MCB9841367.1 hypothetical protein [Phycisphaeraceae bacterium]